jgi:hypothetical protein
MNPHFDKTLSSRRDLLRGAAASVPLAMLAAAPALAHVVSEPDPIFAAIERYRIAAKAEDDAEADLAVVKSFYWRTSANVSRRSACSI